jgi:hypothetical protein
MRKNYLLVHLISIIILWGTAFPCPANTQEKQEYYSDITGYWQEYIINSSAKEKTSIRKIILNSKGNLTQSITYEIATQCRIWLNDDDISYENGHVEFWSGEFSGEISEDKNTVLLTYKQMPNRFLLERIRDEKTIELIDRIEASQGRDYVYHVPEDKGDGWECVNLEDVGLNKQSMIDCVNQIKKLVAGYGYQWWMRSFKVHGKLMDSYYAIGNGGQFIMVFPTLDLIVVSTAQNYDTGWAMRFYNLVYKYILQPAEPVFKN